MYCLGPKIEMQFGMRHVPLAWDAPTCILYACTYTFVHVHVCAYILKYTEIAIGHLHGYHVQHV